MDNKKKEAAGKSPLPPRGIGPTPLGRAFYALNDLYDQLQKMDDHEVNVLLSELGDRVQDSSRMNALIAMVRGYQTRTR